jgi:hypothetical protein
MIVSAFGFADILRYAHVALDPCRIVVKIQHGDGPGDDRLHIRLRHAPRPNLLSMAEQLRRLPGVREVRRTGS